MAAQAYTAGVAAVRNMSGPGSLAGIQALQNKYNTTLQDISDKESKANIELNTREAAANAEIMSRAADQEMKRQSFNSSTRREEEKYRLERIESGLDAAAERITGIVKDEKLDRFNRDLTRVLDNTHSYDRLTIYNQIKKHSKMEDSPFYGKSDRQLQKIAAAYAKQIAAAAIKAAAFQAILSLIPGGAGAKDDLRRVNNSVSRAAVLTSKNGAFHESLTLKLEKPYQKGLWGSFAWTTASTVSSLISRNSRP